ncbi:MAG: penicillin-binding protein 2 [Kiritimatiellales bacterium]|nr:penicillin-binding protein 2 [Kiritimatiellales bacterium]
MSSKLEENRRLEQKSYGSRGRILDRNGEILAIDSTAWHVCADPSYIHKNGDINVVCSTLSREFNLVPSELYDRLNNPGRQYVRLMKFVPGHRLKRFEKNTYGVVYKPDPLRTNSVSGRVETVALKGVMLEEAPIRNYHKGALMAHVVGFANKEGVGTAGIELRMNDYLRGKEGLRVSEKDGQRHELYPRRTVDVKPEAGANIYLTLDQQLQHVVEQTIEKMKVEFNAKGAWAIVQHVRTGEILAMASFPTYDLNDYARAPEEWRRNCAIGFIYEPGSTMKAAVIAAALDQGIVNETDMIDCENGYWVYGGKKLEDSHGEKMLSVADVLKKSSNIGTAKIALMMGNGRLYSSLKKFGFGGRLGVGLAGEEHGIFYKPSGWSKISATRIGMGHEIGVTALQVLSMINAIANDGVQMRPQLVKQVKANNGTVLEEFRPEVIGRPISARTARQMRRLLARVTEEGGTGIKAALDGYTVAGKTGTAQKTRPAAEGGGYYSKNFVSSFVGFLPAEKPEIGIIVVADDPGTFTETNRKIGYYGGTVCGPAFKAIADYAIRYLRIPPEGVPVEHAARPEL